MEEIQELKEEILDLYDRMRYYTLGDNDEIVDPRMMWRNVIVYGDQNCLLKDMIQGLALSYGELTEEIVCTKRLGKDKEIKLMVGIGIAVIVMAVLVYLFV